MPGHHLQPGTLLEVSLPHVSAAQLQLAAGPLPPIHAGGDSEAGSQLEASPRSSGSLPPPLGSPPPACRPPAPDEEPEDQDFESRMQARDSDAQHTRSRARLRHRELRPGEQHFIERPTSTQPTPPRTPPRLPAPPHRHTPHHTSHPSHAPPEIAHICP